MIEEIGATLYNPDQPFDLGQIIGPYVKLAQRCNSCNFTISLTPGHQRKAGVCPGCEEKVCFTCGCTQTLPCAVEVIGGYLPCSWYAPGVCTFCFQRMLELAYKITCRRLLVEDTIDILVDPDRFEEEFCK